MTFTPVDCTAWVAADPAGAAQALADALDNGIDRELCACLAWAIAAERYERDVEPEPAIDLPIERVGALAAWRRRGDQSQDGLWLAACWEATAIEAERSGFYDAAVIAMDKANDAVLAYHSHPTEGNA